MEWKHIFIKDELKFRPEINTSLSLSLSRTQQEHTLVLVCLRRPLSGFGIGDTAPSYLQSLFRFWRLEPEPEVGDGDATEGAPSVRPHLAAYLLSNSLHDGRAPLGVAAAPLGAGPRRAPSSSRPQHAPGSGTQQGIHLASIAWLEIGIPPPRVLIYVQNRTRVQNLDPSRSDRSTPESGFALARFVAQVSPIGSARRVHRCAARQPHGHLIRVGGTAALVVRDEVSKPVGQTASG